MTYSVTAGGSQCLVLGTFKRPENATKQSNQDTLATISKCNMHIVGIITPYLIAKETFAKLTRIVKTNKSDLQSHPPHTSAPPERSGRCGASLAFFGGGDGGIY